MVVAGEVCEVAVVDFGGGLAAGDEGGVGVVWLFVDVLVFDGDRACPRQPMS